MTTAFDQHAINDMTVATSREMNPRGGSPHRDADTLFIGGAHPSDADADALARFGLSKNWKIIFPSFDPADPSSGPTGFHAVVTDGLTQSIVLSNGRLWKRDRRSPSVLVFPDLGGTLSVSAKGRLAVRPMKGRYHDHGYDIAIKALRERASRKPGQAPVVSPIGSLMTVLDLKAMAAMLAAGE